MVRGKGSTVGKKRRGNSGGPRDKKVPAPGPADGLPATERPNPRNGTDTGNPWISLRLTEPPPLVEEPWIDLDSYSPDSLLIGRGADGLPCMELRTLPAFRGWDWEELSYFLGIPGASPFDDGDEDDDEYSRDEQEKLLRATRAHLSLLSSNAMGYASTKEEPIELQFQVKGVRAFVAKLADESEKLDFIAPLWRGLLAIESDSEFLEFSAVLLEYMWT